MAFFEDSAYTIGCISSICVPEGGSEHLNLIVYGKQPIYLNIKY